MTEANLSDAAPRPERCLLSLPPTTERFLVKAAASEADTIMLDLEDAVAPDLKARARGLAIEALNEMDWGTKTICVRINGLDTPWAYRDLIEVAEACPRLDTLMIPKVESPEEVRAVEIFLNGVERAKPRARPVGIEVQIETALGMVNVESIARGSGRLESISFGPGDYAASMGNRAELIGAPDPDYAVLTYPDAEGKRELHWNDVWHAPLSRIATACRAFNLRALDGPYPDFHDPEGFRSSAKRAVSLGFVGKWAIHPSQIPIANEIFGPSEAAVSHARRLLAALEKGAEEGRGAVTLDGKMIDTAHKRQARQILAQAEAIDARRSGTAASSEKEVAP